MDGMKKLSLLPVSGSQIVRPAKSRAKVERARRNSELLTTLHFACEATGKSFDYAVPGDAGTLKDLWSRRLMLSCPHCGEVHAFLFRTAYIRAMLDEPRLPFERLNRDAPLRALRSRVWRAGGQRD